MIPMPEGLFGTILDLYPLRAEDETELTKAAADPLIWAGHPATDRFKPEVFKPYFTKLLDSGGTLIARDKTGRVIGCSRYYDPPDAPGQVAIGYTFLTRDHWRGRSNRVMKDLMFAHAFETVPEVWLHIDPSNIRSQKATARIGAQHVGTGPLTMGGKKGGWQSWKITKPEWEATREQ
ncbi:GNAT family N-acetyltransferase [Pacificoceanicola onchidii]|uniref:GNAT family N-acetyltransferase n=1 Tax=Pacificoceanicola onchidii TaxID=2562685 RepID=UPI0010A628D6|nr:GNAT family N-acetyltransferase [Pacificoceanicola onchidii]